MLPRLRAFFLLASCVWLLAPSHVSTLDVQVLTAVASLPPHIVGMFEEPLGYQRTPNGISYVFDRRGHAVYTIDPERTAARKAIDIGQEQGRIIQPFGFDVSADGRVVVADVPRAQQRVQTFDATGTRLTGFLLPGAPAARITIGNVMLNGIGSIRHGANGLLISHPESGALFTAYSYAGYAQRSIGALRGTGFEDDRQLHMAMNSGLALADPTGGYWWVFVTGRPMLRKYDAAGRLVFERVIQGRELDDLLEKQPTRWPRTREQDREVPLVTPVIRAAAVDPRGGLWIALAVPYTYAYDAQGDKVRTVQFRGAGLLSPSSMAFTHDGRLLVTPGCYEFRP